MLGDRQVKVVAAKDQVVANGDTVELNFVRRIIGLVGVCLGVTFNTFANTN